MNKQPNQYSWKQRVLQDIILFFIGGLIYMGIELMWRGYSDISMFFVGGVCFVLIGLLNEPMKLRNIKIRWQMLIGGCIIVTPLEFIAGYILNIRLSLGIWDYSNLPGNVMGQICPLFTFLWCLLSIVCIFIDDIVRHKLFKQEYPKYYF